MAGYRNVSVSFWTDSKVDDDFTPEDKYFYLYLMTNPHTSLCGCYEISMKQMERETGYNSDTVKRLLKRMETVHDVIRFSEETKEVIILNWWKYNWTASEKVKSAILLAAEHIKNNTFKRYVIDRVSIRYTYTMHTTDTDTVSEYRIQNTETETEIAAESPPKRKRFTPPTIEEVAAYCKERGNNVDPEAFVAFYESKGWKIGREPMKAWKAAVITWEKRNGGTRGEARGAQLEGSYTKEGKTYDRYGNELI